VGIAGNVIWVTSQAPCGEHVHQFEMFAILQYVVKLVIKPIILTPLPGNRCCHGNRFVPRSLGGLPDVSPRV